MAAELSVAYDARAVPPAPVVPIRIGVPGSGRPPVGLVALVDSGAALCVVPARLAHDLGLPRVRTARVAGPGGDIGRIAVHAAEILFGDDLRIAEVLALGTRALLGRNLLNEWEVTLDGPRRTVTWRS